MNRFNLLVALALTMIHVGSGHSALAGSRQETDRSSARLGRRAVTANSADAGTLFLNPIIPVGDGPIAIANTDFNEDGLEDLAVANNGPYGPGDVSVLLGRGDGSFEPERRYAAGEGPIAIVAGDFDADGHQDLVVANEFSDDLTVLLGRGDGTFPLPLSIAAGDSPFAMSGGDFNHDGRPDVAIANYLSDDVAIFQGVSGGIFGAPLRVPVGDSPTSLSAGDFNNDGRLDLAVVRSEFDSVSILLATEQGSFGAPIPLDPITYVRALGVGDFNADGELDLAVGTIHNIAISLQGDAVILLGHGDGTFSERGRFTVGFNPARIAVEDLDQDGRLDLAVANFQSDDVSILLGAGDGSFLPQKLFSAGGGATDLAVGDFNDDGRLDLGVANLSGGDISILVNLGAAAFTVPDNRIHAGDGSEALATSDLNGDNIDDLVLANTSSTNISVLLGRGDGSFGPETHFETGDVPISVAVADLNADGAMDLVVLNRIPGNVSILLGAGDGTFGAQEPVAVGDVGGMLAASDLDGDGWQDLVITSQYTQEIVVLPGRGDGSFREQLRFPAGGFPIAVAIADFDLDGDPDLVVGNTFFFDDEGNYRLGNISLMTNLGRGAFGAPSLVYSDVEGASMAVADLNSDGRPDFVALETVMFRVLPFLNLHDEGFVLQTPLAAGSIANGIVADDLNGDGIVDLAVSNLYSDDVSVLIGRGGGAFLPQMRFRTGAYAFAVVTGDFDRDGRRDLAVENAGANTISILINQGSPANHPPVASAGADAQAECSSPSGASIVLDGSGSSDPDSTPGTQDDIVSFAWFEDFGLTSARSLGTGATLAVTLPVGSHLITLQITDKTGAMGSDAVVVEVIDTTPPAIALALTPATAWPPNHRMVNVEASVVATDACGTPSISLALITSSEPDDVPGGGDGNTTGDIQGAELGIADFGFQLRAERDAAGEGRVYQLTYSAVDAAGNRANATSLVLVPSDQGVGAEPRDPATWEGVLGGGLGVVYVGRRGERGLTIKGGHY